MRLNNTKQILILTGITALIAPFIAFPLALILDVNMIQVKAAFFVAIYLVISFCFLREKLGKIVVIPLAGFFFSLLWAILPNFSILKSLESDSVILTFYPEFYSAFLGITFGVYALGLTSWGFWTSRLAVAFGLITIIIGLLIGILSQLQTWHVYVFPLVNILSSLSMFPIATIFGLISMVGKKTDTRACVGGLQFRKSN